MFTKSFYSSVLCCLLMSGCATTETHMAYYSAEREIRLAEAEALKAKYNAMAEISRHGNDTVKAVALMSLDKRESSILPTSNIKPPENPSDVAFKWLSILAPVGLEAFRTIKSSQVQTHLSDNNLKSSMFTTQSTENTNLGLARLINPTPVIAPNPLVVTQPTPVIVKPEIVTPLVVPVK